MAISSVKWSAGGVGGKTAGANNYAAVVKVTKVSSRDTAYFSAQAKAAVQTAAEKAEETASADKTEDKKTISELIKEQTDKIDSMFSSAEDDKSKDRVLLLIKQKMRGGLMLSANEEKYLSKNDPDSYSNYRTILDARRTFRTQLAMCRNKDDVYGMRLCNALSALSAYKKAIKQGGDGAEVVGLNMALEREISNFSRSGRFQNLPTAAERGKYQIELAKARRYEREKRLAERQNALRKKKRIVKIPGDGKRTVAQVQNSYLGRKIRNADRGGSCGASFLSFG